MSTDNDLVWRKVLDIEELPERRVTSDLNWGQSKNSC